jgi:hypothetical protein
MKSRLLLLSMIFIPTVYLYSQISTNEIIIIDKSTTEIVNLGSTEKIIMNHIQNFSQLEFKAHLLDVGSANSVYSADIDGDGDVDVLGASSTGNEIAWWENLDVGSGSFYKHTIDRDFYRAERIYAVDIDGDNDIDVLGGSYQGNTVAWWENTEADTFAKHLVDDDFKSSVSIIGVDMDSDGDIDVLGASKSGSTIVWWENNGSQNFTKKIVESYFISVSRVYAADIDSDGDMDVVGISSSSSQVAWWENDGTQNFTKHTIGQDLRFGYSVFATDLDSDDDVDVIAADLYGNEIIWWENDGAESFTKDSLDTDIKWPRWLYAADLDNDTDVDILSISHIDDYVCWYENLGSKNFNEYTIKTNFNSANSVHADDFDNDGDVDILAAGSDIYWWENTLITNPNKLLPDIVVTPDSLSFYVGPGENIQNDAHLSNYQSQQIVSHKQSGNEDTVVVSIKNTGDATLYVQNISCPANWIIDIDTTSFLLKPTQEQLVTITCSAEDLYNGIYESILTINSNDPDSPVLEILLLLEMRDGIDVNFFNEIESNNSATEAQELFGPSPSGIKGTISVSDAGDVLISNIGDIEDLYVFTTKSTGIKMKLFGLSADVDILLMTISGNSYTIWGSNHRGGITDEEFENADLAPGTYYIGVSIYDLWPLQDSTSYSLVLEGDIITDVKKYDKIIPQNFALSQNYPNPFNPTTTISFDIPKISKVNIKVFDILGQEVKTLVDKNYQPGTYSIFWYGKNNHGKNLVSGTYFVRLQAEDFIAIQKIILLK